MIIVPITMQLLPMVNCRLCSSNSYLLGQQLELCKWYSYYAMERRHVYSPHVECKKINNEWLLIQKPVDKIKILGNMFIPEQLHCERHLPSFYALFSNVKLMRWLNLVPVLLPGCVLPKAAIAISRSVTIWIKSIVHEQGKGGWPVFQ